MRRIPLLFNQDLSLGMVSPTEVDPIYSANGDGDELIFIFEGGGILRSLLGDVRFEKNDYLFIPRGLIYRLLPDASPQHWFWMEFGRGLAIPSQWRQRGGAASDGCALFSPGFPPPGVSRTTR